jgi:hypothetical protein
MGFEVPLALLALAGIGIPIVAHILRKRDLPTLRLPTIALLARAKAEAQRRVRLTDLLLLLVRIALVACLALGLAGPYAIDRTAAGDSIASIAIVLDDSMSMGRTDGSSTTFDRARAEISTLLDRLPEGSEVSVLLAGAPPRVLSARTTELEAIAIPLADATPTARGTDLPGAVTLAIRELARARFADRRLVVLTDAAAHGAPDGVHLPPQGIAVEVPDLDTDTITNYAIRSIETAPRPADQGGGLVARIEVAGYDAPSEATLELAIERAGSILAEASVEVRDGRGSVDVPLAALEGEEPARATLRTGDALRLDDERDFFPRPGGELRVLVVDGDPDPRFEHDEVGYLARVLDVAGEGDRITIADTVDADTLDSESFDERDAIVLANVRAPSSQTSDRIRAFVERGGGLFVTAGDNVEPAEYTARFGDLLPCRLRPAADSRIGQVVVRSEGATVVPPGPQGLDGAAVERLLLVEDLARDATIELALDDGAPILLHAPFGSGRVALLTTTIDDEWTDLPIRPGYLPLVHRVLDAISDAVKVPRYVVAGHPVELDAGRDAFEVVAPDGQLFEHPRSRRPFTETGLGGVYRVRVSGTDRALAPASSFIVVPPPEESDLRRGELPTQPVGERTRAAGEAERGPLAPWVFLLVALFAIAEGGLRLSSRAIARARRTS